MVHEGIGNWGHLLVITSFVTSLTATFSYFKASSIKDLERKAGWISYARIIFYIHTLAVLGVIVTLFYIIYHHYFEYHYAWSHSSRNLPVHYMISCFWEGQEGSFLLWIFWHTLIGLFLIHRNKTWEAHLMTIFCMVQAFLTSMILGVVILNIKIGSSPFILLRDVLDAPVFDLNPDFVPQDGTGLNPLLQNYWMVIHPPTLFLGFAATLVPFAYCLAGLWRKKYSEWIKPALPWTLFATAILGLGIMMGAYWAYETLNFGGYWNWDPVENAVYVPWLILIACIHIFAIHRKNGTGVKSAILLTISSFILILYATFLTRSGILGEASVHSFTDLGLSGQLLLYLFVFLGLSCFLIIFSWKKIPTTAKEITTYSREFWIFMGAITLCLMAFQVLIPTSFPVYNKIIESFGGISNIAPPADQVAFYSKFQLWFGVAIAILSATGQFFWWKKISPDKLRQAFSVPVIATLLISSMCILIGEMKTPAYIILLTATIYALIANGLILIKIIRSNYLLSGGAIAHIGIALILMGILFSAGYSKTISLNNTGLLYSGEFPDDLNRENILLWLNEPQKMQEYQLTYKGQRIKAKGISGYIDKNLLLATDNPYKVISQKDIPEKGVQEGDTLNIQPENIYYEVAYRNTKGKTFTLYPRAQVNPSMGLLASPDIRKKIAKDLYTHVSSVPDPSQEITWSEEENITVKIGEQFFMNDFVAVLEQVEPVTKIEGITLDSGDVAVRAAIKIFDKTNTYKVKPLFLIKNRMVGQIPETVWDLGLKITFINIHPDTADFTFGVYTTQKDYIILKVIEKPLINILWLGSIMVTIGFTLAIVKRYRMLKK